MVERIDLTVRVKRVIHHNKETGFTTFLAEALKLFGGSGIKNFEQVYSGYTNHIYVNQVYEVSFFYFFNSSSKAFSTGIDEVSCIHMVPEVPKDEQGVRDFLAPFIANKRVKNRIISKYRESSIAELERNKSAWDDFFKKPCGDIAEKVLREFKDLKSYNELENFLSSCGVRASCGIHLFNKHHEKALEEIKANPYSLFLENCINFKEAKSIAEAVSKSGGQKEPINVRIAAGISEVMRQETVDCGNIYTDKKDLIDKVNEIFEFADEQNRNLVSRAVDNDIDKLNLFRDDSYLGSPIYQKAYYDCEMQLAECFKQLIQTPKKAVLPAAFIQPELDRYRTSTGYELTMDQKLAIYNALTLNVSVITGGPGTGKTEIIRAIYEIIHKKISSTRICMCAPTGKAATRVAELTQACCRTIHYLVACHDEHSEVQYDYVIIDEFSMVPFHIMQKFLGLVNPDCRLIMIGDANQLPSVDPGALLSDLLNVNGIAQLSLDTVFRQEKQSEIITLADSIVYNRPLDLTTICMQSSDIQICEVPYNEDLVKAIIEQVELLLAHSVDEDSIQVIAPTKIYESGSNNLNEVLEAKLNRSGSSDRLFGFRVNDRVLQLQNQYSNDDTDVFNGQIGKVTKINKNITDQYVEVDFSAMKKPYGSEDIDNLSLAYAMTIHKSQGSEFDYVLLALDKNNSKHLTRKMLYTAVTRARKKLIIIDKDKTFENELANPQQDTPRRSHLADRINKECHQKPEIQRGFQTTLY